MGGTNLSTVLQNLIFSIPTVWHLSTSAENPEAGFKPNSGTVQELNFRSSSNVWGYFSVNSSGGGVHEYADSQFGHVFSYGETREAARRNLVVALRELSIRGDFRTTVDYLVKLLETETYINNAVTTSWLDSLITSSQQRSPISSSSSSSATSSATDKPDANLVAVCGAVCKAVGWMDKNRGECDKALDRGQPLSRSALSSSTIVDFIYNDVRYKLKVSFTSPETIMLSNMLAVVSTSSASSPCSTLDGSSSASSAIGITATAPLSIKTGKSSSTNTASASASSATTKKTSATTSSSLNLNEVGVKRMVDGGFSISISGKKHYMYSQEEMNSMVLTVDTKVCRLEKDSDPTELRSPSPGKLVRYLVQDGGHVNNGEAFAEIEVSP